MDISAARDWGLSFEDMDFFSSLPNPFILRLHYRFAAYAAQVTLSKTGSILMMKQSTMLLPNSICSLFAPVGYFLIAPPTDTDWRWPSISAFPEPGNVIVLRLKIGCVM